MIAKGHGCNSNDGCIIVIAKLRHHSSAAKGEASSDHFDRQHSPIWENSFNLGRVHLGILSGYSDLDVDEHVLTAAWNGVNHAGYGVERDRVSNCTYRRLRRAKTSVAVLIASKPQLHKHQAIQDFTGARLSGPKASCAPLA